MFTPEFVSVAQNEVFLLSTHRVETEECLALSIAFNQARLRYAREHLPDRLRHCIMVYDVRGQTCPPMLQETLSTAFGSDCEVRIMT